MRMVLNHTQSNQSLSILYPRNNHIITRYIYYGKTGLRPAAGKSYQLPKSNPTAPANPISSVTSLVRCPSSPSCLPLSSLLSFQVYSQSTADQGPLSSSHTVLKHLCPASSFKPLTSLSWCLFPFHVESPPFFIKSNQGVYYEIPFKFNLLRLL